MNTSGTDTMTDNQHEILATEATLSTLKVEIKTLTVSGEKMTLAIFQQLPVMDAIQIEDGELWPDAHYWGLVRYPEGKLWAVMERDGKPYRGRFDEIRYWNTSTRNQSIDSLLALPQLFIIA